MKEQTVFKISWSHLIKELKVSTYFSLGDQGMS